MPLPSDRSPSGCWWLTRSGQLATLLVCSSCGFPEYGFAGSGGEAGTTSVVASSSSSAASGSTEGVGGSSPTSTGGGGQPGVGGSSPTSTGAGGTGAGGTSGSGGTGGEGGDGGSTVSSGDGGGGSSGDGGGATTGTGGGSTGSGPACDGNEDCPPLTNAAPLCFNGNCILGPCDAGFENCDDVTSTGCEAELATSELHCGGCGRPCTNAHGSTTCELGVCDPVCDDDWDTCDGNPSNGCETSTTTVANCNGCDLTCDFAQAAETCPAGLCTMGTCSPGFGDCDDNEATGCETDTTTSNAHCGDCNMPCTGQEICSEGNCGAACAAGTGNCDAQSGNGCETNTDTDSDDCGNCVTSCSSIEVCTTGSCSACSGALRDCDRDGGNGCEVNTGNNPLSCGGCAATCGSDGTCGCSSSACSGGTIYFSEDFSDNSRSWTLAGEWAIGPTSVSTGHQRGFPDPGSDHSASADNGVAGVVLGGNYDVQIHAADYMTSPAVNLSSAAGTVNLTYWRQLNADWDPFATETVEVWNGSTWIELYNSKSVGNVLITENGWMRWTHDVTAHKNAAFRVRFGHQTGKQGNFLSWVMSGWNIDDLTLSSGVCQ